MITYKQRDSQTWVVRLAGKVVGQIVESKMGFRYFPKGGAAPGDWFTTLSACQKSLEAE